MESTRSWYSKGIWQVLSQVNFYMKQHHARYGFVLTDLELVAIRRLDRNGIWNSRLPFHGPRRVWLSIRSWLCRLVYGIWACLLQMTRTGFSSDYKHSFKNFLGKSASPYPTTILLSVTLIVLGLFLSPLYFLCFIPLACTVRSSLIPQISLEMPFILGLLTHSLPLCMFMCSVFSWINANILRSLWLIILLLQNPVRAGCISNGSNKL